MRRLASRTEESSPLPTMDAAPSARLQSAMNVEEELVPARNTWLLTNVLLPNQFRSPTVMDIAEAVISGQKLTEIASVHAVTRPRLQATVSR